MRKEDVGKGYYCEFIAFGAYCPASKRTSCIGCKGRRKHFKDKSRNYGVYNQ